jgi:hypothetical protein
MLRSQIEIREKLLNSLGTIRTLLVRQMADEPLLGQPATVSRRRKNGRRAAGRALKRVRNPHHS